MIKTNVFSGLQEMFLSNFIRVFFKQTKAIFMPAKILYRQGVIGSKATVLVIYVFRELQETFLSNFCLCRLPGK